MSKESLSNATAGKAIYIQAINGFSNTSKAAQFSRNQANFIKQNQTYN